MPQQEINLLQQFKKAHSDADYLTWRRYWMANGVFFLLLILVYIGSILNNHQLSAKLNIANADLITYENNYKTIKNTLPQFLFSSNVNDTVTNLKKELATQKVIIQILSKHNPFSKDLIALSNAIVPNVWLTKFVIQKSGDNIILTGNSFGIDNLQDFIGRLKKDNAFNGYAITIKQINNENVKDQKSKLTFELNLVKNSNG